MKSWFNFFKPVSPTEHVNSDLASYQNLSFKPNPILHPLSNVYVVFDTETSGLDAKKHELLSISAVKIVDGKIAVSESLDFHFTQQHETQKESVVIHEILRAEQNATLSESDGLLKLLGFFQDAVLVAHNVAFDRLFLNKALSRQFNASLKNYSLDTAKLAMRLDYGSLIPNTIKPSEYSLESLCKRYKINNDAAHTASADTLTTAILFLKLMHRLNANGLLTNRQLF